MTINGNFLAALLTSGTLFGAIPMVLPAAEYQGPVVSLVEENDSFLQSDHHYTQGLKLTYLFRDEMMPGRFSGVSKNISEFGIDVEARKFGIVLGQNIYTPDNISNPRLNRNDRPYAGWLYGGVILQRRGKANPTTPVLENFEIQAGIIGPESLAENAQREWHELVDAAEPRGWKHQLKTEPGLVVRYVRTWLFRYGEDVTLDLIPTCGVSLGNVATHATVGGVVRVGINVPHDFGVNTIDSPSSVVGDGVAQWGAYVFAGADIRLVGYNVFMDGNMFRNSHSVEKRYLVGDVKAGAALVLKRCELSYTMVLRTPEFHAQSNPDIFASIACKWNF